jgi:hypothetical protein
LQQCGDVLDGASVPFTRELDEEAAPNPGGKPSVAPA